ncbi:hypothetical protein BDF14DRAFT_1759079 [Spinellus fusiger]|nr:hypothetical protein BDF14DRAFT_1759079 [Spinellus fusiger]
MVSLVKSILYRIKRCLWNVVSLCFISLFFSYKDLKTLIILKVNKIVCSVKSFFIRKIIILTIFTVILIYLKRYLHDSLEK